MIASRCRLRVFGCLVCFLPLTGCFVNTHKDGNHKDVEVSVPFAHVHVNTDAGKAPQTGLPVYPGATLVRKHGGDDDDGAADVNLSLGAFKVSVHAAEFVTHDPADKVLAFYRKDMGRFGAVLLCQGGKTLGQPTRTAEGLTCDKDRHEMGDEDETQLRAGSPQKQHIVGVKTQDGATHIAMVALELPRGLHTHDSDEQE